MRDLAIALFARWIIQAICVAAVVTHGGNLLLALALAVVCGTGLVWSTAEDMARPTPT